MKALQQFPLLYNFYKGVHYSIAQDDNGKWDNGLKVNLTKINIYECEIDVMCGAKYDIL